MKTAKCGSICKRINNLAKTEEKTQTIDLQIDQGCKDILPFFVCQQKKKDPIFKDSLNTPPVLRPSRFIKHFKASKCVTEPSQQLEYCNTVVYFKTSHRCLRESSKVLPLVPVLWTGPSCFISFCASSIALWWKLKCRCKDDVYSVEWELIPCCVHWYSFLVSELTSWLYGALNVWLFFCYWTKFLSLCLLTWYCERF